MRKVIRFEYGAGSQIHNLSIKSLLLWSLDQGLQSWQWSTSPNLPKEGVTLIIREKPFFFCWHAIQLVCFFASRINKTVS